MNDNRFTEALTAYLEWELKERTEAFIKWAEVLNQVGSFDGPVVMKVILEESDDGQA